MGLTLRKINSGSVAVTESEWMECQEPKRMLVWLSQSGRPSERNLALFSVASVA
jgi:hypothetical protein